MTTTIKQIVKEVLDQMEGETFSEHKQFREVLEGKLTSRLNHLISGLKEEASHECVYPDAVPVDDPVYRCSICGMIKNNMPSNIQKVIEEGVKRFDEEHPIGVACTKRWGCDNCGGCYANDMSITEAKAFLSTTISNVLQAIEEAAGRETPIEAAFPISSFMADWKKGYNAGVAKVIALVKSARDSVK